MLPCRDCGREAFIFRGVCAACDPVLHAALDYERAIWHQRFAQFTAETTTKPLEDWTRFEQWCKEKNYR